MVSDRSGQLSEPEAVSTRRFAAVRGLVTGITRAGTVLVSVPENSAGETVAAGSAVAIGTADVGREAVLLFEDGDPKRPIIVGILRPADAVRDPSGIEVTADGKRVTITAEEQIELKCGDASITLTRAGKILIRGTHVVSRSSGANRIKGGSVEIN